LSRKTSAVIKQNMVIGGVFIVVFMALSAANYVTPVMASVLNLVSGLLVVFNSARLVRCGEQIEQAEASQGVDTVTPPTSDEHQEVGGMFGSMAVST